MKQLRKFPQWRARAMIAADWFIAGVALMAGWVLFSVLLTAAQALIDWAFIH